jgi:poly(3-hydroxybutyrate) depolymerase
VLYQLYEMWHASMAPWRLMGAAVRQSVDGYGAAFGAPKAASQDLSAGWQVFERLTRRYEKPAFGLPTTVIDGAKTVVREEIQRSLPFCNLLHFRRDSARHDPRLLLIAPMSGHFATLARGTVEALLPGYDVYVTDWKNARDVPADQGCFDLDSYIDYVIDFLRELGPETHVLAVCQAAVPALAAVALMSAEDKGTAPRSMTLMAGPIEPRSNPTAVNRFATAWPLEWFRQGTIAEVPARYAGASRRVYPGFLQLGSFMAMHPDNHITSHVRYLEDLAKSDERATQSHERFYDEYFSVMDLTAEFYLQTVDSVFQKFELARGTMVSRGRPVRPAAITGTALMTIEGERDDISGLGQTRAAQDLCSSLPADMRAHYVQPDTGHFGVFSGHHWRNEVLPRLSAFIEAHG